MSDQRVVPKINLSWFPTRVKKWSRNKLLTFREIHIEELPLTERKLTSFMQNHPETMLMLRCDAVGPSPSAKESYSRLMAKFPNRNHGLHVHTFSTIAAVGDSYDGPLPSYQEQLGLIQKGVADVGSLGIKTRDITFGCWATNLDSIIAAMACGLDRIHLRLKFIGPLTRTFGVPVGCEIVPIDRSLHDYDL